MAATLEQQEPSALPRNRLSAGPAVLAGVLLLALGGGLFRYGVFIWATGQTGFLPFAEALCVWDCGWYRTIVEGGYDLTPGMRLRPGAANWAFFPLYPIIAAGVKIVTGWSVPVIGFVMSNVFIVATAWFSRPLFRGNESAYWLTVLALMAGPFSFLFNTLYTESLYILLSVLVFVALQRSSYLAAGGWTALLSATRVTGVLMVFAILVQVAIDHRRGGGRWQDFPLRVLQDTKLLLTFAVAPLGLFAYMAYLHAHMGDALAFAHIQRAWGRELGNPFEVLWSALTLPWPLTPDAMVIVSWGIGAWIGLLLCLLVAVSGRWPEAIFCTLVILLSLAGGITSMIRYVAGLFPLGMAVSELLAKNRLVLIIAAVLVVVADAVLMFGWMRSSLFVM